MKSSGFGRIGVLMGGPSSEREISFKSGKAVYESLKGLGLDVVKIDITSDKVKENTGLIRSNKIDCAFISLHGRFGEDGGIQRVLEGLKLPYTASGVMASQLAMDKISSRRIFEIFRLNVPRYLVLTKKGFNPGWRVVNQLSLPLVVKPATNGSSIGLTIVDKEKDLARAVDLAFGFDQRILVEEYIPGREMTVGVLDQEPLPVIEIVPKKRFFDFQAKYQHGLTEYVVPAKISKALSKKIQSVAISAHKHLGCSGCSRVDIILSKNNMPFVLEVNTVPGMTETSLLPKAASKAGINFSGLCLKLIKLAYEKT